ncbi:MAG: hypothetical protein V2A55_02440 [Candidatus Jorgensenbacteria bacterium]
MKRLPVWLKPAAATLGALSLMIMIYIAVGRTLTPRVGDEIETVYATPPSDYERQFVDICRERVRLDRIVESTNQLIEESRTPPAQRPTVSEALAEVERRELAKRFLAVLSMPRLVRLKAEPCHWHALADGGLELVYLDDPFDVVEEIAYLLNPPGNVFESNSVSIFFRSDGDGKLGAIGTTSAEFKRAVLNDVRLQLLEVSGAEEVVDLIAFKACRRGLDLVELGLDPAEYVDCRRSS